MNDNSSLHTCVQGPRGGGGMKINDGKSLYSIEGQNILLLLPCACLHMIKDYETLNDLF